MELYLLDKSYRQMEPVIDTFDSLLWTDRYNSTSDMQLMIPSDSPVKALLPEKQFVGIDDSKNVMQIQSRSDQDGECTIVGKSLDYILTSRQFRDTWSPAASSWNLTGRPAAMMQYVMAQMVIAGGRMDGTTIFPNGHAEIISFLQLGVEPGDGTSTSYAAQYGTVYDTLQGIIGLDPLGYIMYPVLTPTGYILVFDIYRGKDRTTSQKVNTPIILQSAMDTLTDIQELRSIDGFATHAYAIAQGMTSQASMGVAVASGYEAATDFEKRTIIADASDVDQANYTATTIKPVLDQRARTALANNNYVRMTSGQLVPQDNFVYGTDYTLGDVIELRGDDGLASSARITEYIRSQNSTGISAYPTLTAI